MAIMMGLAIGAAMGGGIAALQGKKMDDILKGAAIGGVMGAAGGAFAPAAGLGGATVEGAGSTLGSTALVDGGTAASAFPVTGSPSGAPLGEMFNSQGISNLLPPTQALSPVDLNSAGDSLISGPTGAEGDNSVNFIRGLRMPGSPSISDVAPTASDGLGIKPPAGFMTQTPKPDGFFDSGVGKFLADNKGTLGLGAAGLLMSNKGSSQSSQPESDSYIRPYEYSQVENPDYKGAGTPYFKQSFTAKAPIKTSDFGATTVANGGIIRMAEGGETTQEQRESTSNPTLEALAAIQQAQQSYQPPTVSQGITQPLIQPQMAEVQQRYTTPQRAVPADFQYQAPQFVSYGIGGGGGGYGSLVDPTTGKSIDPTVAAKAAAAAKAASGKAGAAGIAAGAAPYMAGASAPYDPKNPTSIMPDTGDFRAPVPITSLNPAGVVGYDHNPLKSEEIGRAQIYYGTSPGESDRYTVPVSPYANTGYGTVGMGDGAGYSSGTGYSGVELDPGYYNLKVPTSSENLANIYQEMLGRAPDASGIESFSNMAPDQVVSAIIASPEYQATNGPAPEPTYYYGGQEMYTPEYAQVRPDAYYDPNAMMGGGGGDADGGLIADKHPKYAMGGGIGGYYPEPDDGNQNFGGIESLNQGPQYPMQGYAMGGHLGGYSDGGQLLRGPGDGVSDDIPAQIGSRQPARLADGEFVVPARIVSELGNGSTDAGAKRLYAMMDRIQKNRGKTVGKGKVAVNSRSDKYLPA
jgi:hypothetical protein